MNANQITQYDTIRLRESKDRFAYNQKVYGFNAEIKIYKISAEKAKKKVAKIFQNAPEGSTCKNVARQLLSNRNIWELPIYEARTMSYVKNGVNLCTVPDLYYSYILAGGSEKDWVIEEDEDGVIIYTGGINHSDFARNVNDICHKFSFVVMCLKNGFENRHEHDYYLKSKLRRRTY